MKQKQQKKVCKYCGNRVLGAGQMCASCYAKLPLVNKLLSAKKYLRK